MPIKEQFPQKLLVEGNNDQHVVWALCEKFKLSQNFDVLDTKGIDNILKAIPIRLKQADLETLGIIVDADENLSKRWQQLQTVFLKANISLPNELPKEGLITQEDEIRIGIWLMPNNELAGKIEDFIRFLIPDDDKLLTIVENTLDTLENQNLNQYAVKDRVKALIHTWLAWQESPGTPLGQAITKKYLDTTEQVCQVFIDWLKNLFNA